MRLMGKKGGMVRARKHSKAQLREWGKLGGRPKEEPTERLSRSRKFRAWGLVRHKLDNFIPGEHHYSPAEIAKTWGVSPDTIRQVFEHEPGVLIIGDRKGSRTKRRYRTIRIPESVMARVHQRLSNGG